MKTTHFAEKSFFFFCFRDQCLHFSRQTSNKKRSSSSSSSGGGGRRQQRSLRLFFFETKKKKSQEFQEIKQSNNRTIVNTFFTKFFHFLVFFLFVSAPKKENNIEIRIFFFSRSSLKDISLSSLVLPLVVLFLFGDGEGGGARDTFQQYNIQNQQINKNVLLHSKKRNNRTTGAREGAAGGAKVCVCVCVSFIQSSTPKTERARDSVKHFAFFFLQK